ncbi:hypothetical protein PFISCL1PPCAC_26622, partial [Pristionchus fissidentatus]
IDSDKVQKLRLSEMTAIFSMIQVDWKRYLKSVSPSNVQNYFESEPEISLYQFNGICRISELLMSIEKRTIVNFLMLTFTEGFKLSYNEKMNNIREVNIKLKKSTKKI